MPGYLGGGGSSGGTGGEIRFPKEFVDPVTKLRVSNPENLIDTDFEYGLQPTKWETVELINNTPSFFSKSGDTTIDNILSITTNQGTREIIVRTSQEHLLAVGIPINVQGSKSLTADGAYIINSIPDPFTFTYLCKDTQTETAAINDLYTSIITGEFFQGSQLRISDDNGIVTNGAGLSVLTVTTDSTHGFGINTPFYFLNLNSAIAQEFQAANTASKSFDASNSATAQTFDGSNTLSSINIDFSNSGVAGGTVSNIQSVNTIDETITVTHTTETFENLTLGTPLYYNVTAGSGFFLANPRGVVFLKTIGSLGSTSSTFQVSETPDGPPIDLQGAMTGTFQISNQSRTFAGNNRNPETEIGLTIIRDEPFIFDGGNQGFTGEEGGTGQTNGLATVLGYSDTVLVSTAAGAGLDYYPGAMVLYSTTGNAATGLTNNTTYFINSITASVTPDLYTLTIKAMPDSEAILTPSGGSGTQTFQKIGVSIDKDIVHIQNSNFVQGDLLEYIAPENGAFETEVVDDEKQFYFVETAYDSSNFQLKSQLFSVTQATGGTITEIVTTAGTGYTVHAFTSVGQTDFVVNSVGTVPEIEYLIVGGGGSGGARHGGGGGAGGFTSGKRTITAGTYPIVVGAGGLGKFADAQGNNGQNSSAFGLVALGGGGGGSWLTSQRNGLSGGSGGGGSEVSPGQGGAGLQPSSASGGFGFAGAISQQNGTGQGSGGGGAGGVGTRAVDHVAGPGGPGRSSSILGTTYFFAGGGGGGSWESASGSRRAGNGGIGGGGGGGQARSGTVGTGGGSALNAGGNGTVGIPNATGGDGGANTGGGGGGGGAYPPNTGYQSTRGGNGGSGIVVVRYRTTPPADFTAPVATGGAVTDVDQDGVTYRMHAFTTVGSSTFSVEQTGSIEGFEVLVVGGGGGGGGAYGAAGGGGAGGVVHHESKPLFLGSYTVTVGGGGSGGIQMNSDYSASSAMNGNRGGNSSFDDMVAIGGGGGNMSFYAQSPASRRDGGSGGGGGDYYTPIGVNWIGGNALQTNSGGGTGYGSPGGSRGPGGPTVSEDGAHAQPHEGAGGGGAGGVPTGGSSGAPSNGGIGINFPQFAPYGSPAGWFAGGGGGGQHYQALGTQTNSGVGGFFGGGGLGADERALNNGSGSRGSTPGAATTGGGGGGGARNYSSGTRDNAKPGGSGIVIVRYPITAP